MIKMNKNGWGLRVELAFILLFLICIIISSIGLRKFGLLTGNNDTNVTSNDFYNKIENQVSRAAKKYYNRYYINGNDQTVYISVESLVTNGYLDEVKDKYNNDCTGYATILINGTTQSYLSCKYYKTPGYNEEYDY